MYLFLLMSSFSTTSKRISTVISLFQFQAKDKNLCVCISCRYNHKIFRNNLSQMMKKSNPNNLNLNNRTNYRAGNWTTLLNSHHYAALFNVYLKSQNTLFVLNRPKLFA